METETAGMGSAGQKKRYKVVYDRANCAGVLTCVAFYPDRWVTSKQENKADLVGGKEEANSPGTWVLEFTEEELEKFKAAVDVCPVKVISIFDLETNEEIKL
ncbi:MAG: ferredoxin [archaeon]